ncbi:serine/threonine-protein phosphatase 2A activator-like [Zophobas morio]|uniref:serine/threonine-protein phosphatase 2A activator-like n=1 Tax=Zophobas morio TaxID=2755281 RepID=UPI003082CAA9
MGLFVFKKYLGVVRNLQKTYCVEPAGSQGVWGLDDFQFLPFLWGSSQMIACPPSTLKSISSPEFCKKEGGCNLFLEAVAYVHASKSGPFFEHSPVLYEISQSDSWDKVNRGLFRMYKDRVLHQLSIIRHIHFGTILSLKKNTEKVL